MGAAEGGREAEDAPPDALCEVEESCAEAEPAEGAGLLLTGVAALGICAALT